ncbi:MAG: gamma-glutamyl-gamma-aminobutyrate hydrolase family protein [Clostridia bacterium]|nr:gamma-glutamyl-gamma-aminobutyrate hydrolase family protein [Clostridia bacterium]
MENKPQIGVVASRRGENGRLIVNPNIARFITDNGGEVRAYDYEKLKLYELIGEVVQTDGFVFPGGGDLNPSYYEQEKLPECAEPVRAWDDLEMNLFPLLMARGLPILGICRGCQVINVGFGGTLIQDLPSQKGLNHRQDDKNGAYSHTVHITPGTRLSAAVGMDELNVNSYHHQAIDEVAGGFRVCARAHDGTVEGIESAAPAQFILGVQWHPEMLPDDPASKAVFAAFMDAVRKHKSIKCSKED